MMTHIDMLTTDSAPTRAESPVETAPPLIETGPQYDVRGAVTAINNLLLAPGDPDHLFSSVTGVIARTFEYPFAAVLLFSSEQQTLQLAGVNNRVITELIRQGDLEGTIHPKVKLDDVSGAAWVDFFLKGELYVTSNVEDLATHFFALPRARAWRRYFKLCVGAVAPLVARDKIVGALVVASRRPHMSSAEKEDLLFLAQHTAVALEMWQLYTRAERRATEEAALARSARMIARAETGDVLRSIVKAASELTLGSRCCAFLIETDGTLRCVEVCGEHADLALGMTLQPGEGLAGSAFSSGTPLLVDDVLTHPLLTRRHIAEQMSIRSYMAVPMVWEQDRIGVLTASHPEQGIHTSAHLDLLTTFADHAAIAIQHDRLYSNLKEHVAERDSFVKQILTGQEAERRRMAVSVHDGPLQTIGTNLLTIDRARKHLAQGRHDAALAELALLREDLVEVVSTLREILSDLRPPMLEMQGLVAAAGPYLEAFSKSNSVEVALHDQTDGERLPATIELVFYRLMQEALTNVRKHSAAASVAVTIGLEGPTAHMTITDNGRGFNPTSALTDSLSTGRLGLHSMWERLDLIGGNLDITSDPNEGTSITFTAPVT